MSEKNEWEDLLRRHGRLSAPATSNGTPTSNPASLPSASSGTPADANGHADAPVVSTNVAWDGTGKFVRESGYNYWLRKGLVGRNLTIWRRRRKTGAIAEMVVDTGIVNNGGASHGVKYRFIGYIIERVGDTRTADRRVDHETAAAFPGPANTRRGDRRQSEDPSVDASAPVSPVAASDESIAQPPAEVQAKDEEVTPVDPVPHMVNDDAEVTIPVALEATVDNTDDQPPLELPDDFDYDEVEKMIDQATAIEADRSEPKLEAVFLSPLAMSRHWGRLDFGPMIRSELIADNADNDQTMAATPSPVSDGSSLAQDFLAAGSEPDAPPATTEAPGEVSEVRGKLGQLEVKADLDEEERTIPFRPVDYFFDNSAVNVMESAAPEAIYAESVSGACQTPEVDGLGLLDEVPQPPLRPNSITPPQVPAVPKVVVEDRELVEYTFDRAPGDGEQLIIEATRARAEEEVTQPIPRLVPDEDSTRLVRVPPSRPSSRSKGRAVAVLGGIAAAACAILAFSFRNDLLFNRSQATVQEREKPSVATPAKSEIPVDVAPREPLPQVIGVAEVKIPWSKWETALAPEPRFAMEGVKFASASRASDALPAVVFDERTLLDLLPPTKGTVYSNPIACREWAAKGVHEREGTKCVSEAPEVVEMWTFFRMLNEQLGTPIFATSETDNFGQKMYGNWLTMHKLVDLDKKNGGYGWQTEGRLQELASKGQLISTLHAALAQAG